MTAVPAASMRAAFITALGPAEAIRVGDLPMPAPGPTEVLVRVAAAAVNPVDTFIRSGAYRTAIPLPFIVGRDLVGTVAAAGAGAGGFSPGDWVWTNSLGHRGRQGAAAEYAVVGVERLYHLPGGVDPIQAVAVLHPGATAYLGLFHHARLQFGETVYVGGGGGNVGTAAIQLAAAAGCRVIASARPDDHEWCLRQGAAAVVDYRAPDLAAHLREAAPAGIDVHVDTSGQHDLDAAVQLLAQRGRIVLLAGLQQRPALPVGPLYTKDGRIVGFALSNAGVDELAQAAAAINRGLEAKTLVARVVAVLPLAGTARAHQLVEGSAPAGKVRGRVVLRLPVAGNAPQ